MSFLNRGINSKSIILVSIRVIFLIDLILSTTQDWKDSAYLKLDSFDFFTKRYGFMESEWKY